ncbi:MAG: hypothetical protein H0U70_09475 [Tatlockia sp.]|nr:hypothetical protein [Tatlockia sp.]
MFTKSLHLKAKSKQYESMELAVLNKQKYEKIQDRSTSKYSKLIKAIEILERMPSAKCYTNLEWCFGIIFIIALVFTPAAIGIIEYIFKGKELGAIFEHQEKYYKNSTNKPHGDPVAYLILLFVIPILLLMIITTCCIPFFCILLSRKEYKNAFATYDKLQFNLQNIENTELEAINEILEYLNINKIHASKTQFLTEMYHKKLKYDGLYTFWRSNSFPNDIYTKIFSLVKQLLDKDSKFERKDLLAMEI